MTDACASQTLVTRWDVSVGDLPTRVLTAHESGRLLLLPDKTVDGVAVYRDDVAGLIKTLRHRGVDIDFASAREDRRYLSEYGAAEVVAVIGLAVAGNLSSDLVKNVALTVWHRALSALGAESTREEVASANVTVKIAEIVRTDQETVIRGLEVTGPVADIEPILRDAVSGRRPIQLPFRDLDTTGSEDAPE